MDNISSDDRNSLLVILGLLLTATFQASLSPPGSVWQGNSSSKSTSSVEGDEQQPGTSVMRPFLFLLFYIPTCAVFMVTFFLILALLKPSPHGFRTALQVLLAFLAICFEAAVSVIAPTNREYIIIQTISMLVFIIMMFMCIAFRVSRISVLILGCWFITAAFYPHYSFVGNLILVCWLFFFQYDEFWKRTVLALGYCLFVSGLNYQPLKESGIVLGCWFFLGLCRFCIQRINFFCTRWVIMTQS